jgi:hypothetical protein
MAYSSGRGYNRSGRKVMRYFGVSGSLLLLAVICLADVPANEITRDRVLSNPEWKGKYDAYNPGPDQISALKDKLGGNLRIDIYLGLWCSDSRNNVPPFVKILDAAGVPVPVRFFNVQRKPVKTIQYFVDKFKVDRVPTFIFYRGDQEIGRIVENPKTVLAEDTLEILSR